MSLHWPAGRPTSLCLKLWLSRMLCRSFHAGVGLGDCLLVFGGRHALDGEVSLELLAMREKEILDGATGKPLVEWRSLVVEGAVRRMGHSMCAVPLESDLQSQDDRIESERNSRMLHFFTFGGLSKSRHYHNDLFYLQ